MSNPAQKRAIKDYRRRLQERGVARFEVHGLEGDRDLIRSLAKRLAQNDPEAIRIRSEVMRIVSNLPRTKGGILAVLPPLAPGWRGSEDRAAIRCGPERRSMTRYLLDTNIISNATRPFPLNPLRGRRKESTEC